MPDSNVNMPSIYDGVSGSGFQAKINTFGGLTYGYIHTHPNEGSCLSPSVVIWFIKKKMMMKYTGVFLFLINCTTSACGTFVSDTLTMCDSLGQVRMKTRLSPLGYEGHTILYYPDLTRGHHEYLVKLHQGSCPACHEALG